MRTLIISLLVCLTITASAQQVEDYFVSSANFYLQDNTELALKTVGKGLDKFPNDPKLMELKKKIEEQQDSDKQKGKDKEGEEEQENSKQNPEDNDGQQESGQEDGRNRGEEGTGSSDENPLNARGEEESENLRDQGERLQKQRYDNILKALENQEQETQRRLMLGKSKSKLGRKQKDW